MRFQKKNPRPKRPKVAPVVIKESRWRKGRDFVRDYSRKVAVGIWSWLKNAWEALCTFCARVPVPLAIFLITLVVFSYRPLVQGLDDNTPLRFGALLLASGGACDWEVLGDDITNCNSFSRTPSGDLVSHTPIGTAVLGAVFFKIALLLGFDMGPENIVFFDCQSAAFISALTVAMMAWLVRRRGRRTAFLLALLFAFGTAIWGVSSRQLWQHTGELFWLLAGLCVLDGASRHGLRLIVATVLFALAFWCRPQTITIIAVVMIYQWRRNWRIGIIALFVMFILMLVWMVGNYLSSGHLLGTYLHQSLVGGLGDFVSIINPFNLRDFGLLGAYFSPNIGICVFSPLVLLGICLLPWAWRRRKTDPETAVMALATAIGVVVRGLVPNWAGWNVFGGRYMLDFLPCMMLVIAPMMQKVVDGEPSWSARKLRAMRILFIVVGVLSVLIQWLGVTRDSHLWNIAMWKRHEYWYTRKAWDFKHPMLLHMLTKGRYTVGWPDSPDKYTIPKDGKMIMKSGANPYIWYGWTDDPTIGWWTVPPESGLAITLNRREWFKIRFTVAGPSYVLDPTRVDFYWNGEKIGEHYFEGGFLAPETTEWMDLPRTKLNVGKVSYLTVRTSRPYYGRLASQGATGVAFMEIEIRGF